MPGTVTSDQTTIDAADALTNWLSLGTWATALQINADMQIQGTDTIVGRCSANIAWGLAATAAAVDLTTGAHVFAWVKNVTWPASATRANGGLRIALSSDTTPTIAGTSPLTGPSNGKTWFVGGSDTDTVTGWTCYAIDPQSTPNVLQGTPVLTGVNRVGGGADIINTVGAGNFKPSNILFDAVRYGTGLTITGGTVSAPAGFADFFAADGGTTANEYGVITSIGGLYFGAGKLTVGTSSQTAVSVFNDKNQVLVFQAFPVANTAS